MQEDLKYVTLEDEKDYVILDEIENNGTTYVYLTNIDDEKDFCIRKLDVSSTEIDLLVGLDSDVEFDKALLLFTKKHQNDDLTNIEE